MRNLEELAGRCRRCRLPGWRWGLWSLCHSARGALVQPEDLLVATYRLEHTSTDRVARTLSAWSVTSSATIATLTALWGLLASITSPRTAIAIAGLLLLATPLLLPRHDRAQQRERVLTQEGA